MSSTRTGDNSRWCHHTGEVVEIERHARRRRERRRERGENYGNPEPMITVTIRHLQGQRVRDRLIVVNPVYQVRGCRPGVLRPKRVAFGVEPDPFETVRV